MIDYNIVLIADRIGDKSFLSMDSNTLEQIDDSYYFQIFTALQRISKSVVHYNDLPTFMDNIKKHKNDIVFTIYGGSSSRNRMALVPGICEAYGIKYVGADVYNRIICQDKQISKELARQFNFLVPKSITIESESCCDILDDRDLKYPVVIKPLLEGSSIGIDDNSLCFAPENISCKVKELYKQFPQGIMVEEFIPGKEIVTCMVGSRNNIRLCEMVEVCSTENPKYFNDHLYTNQIKHQHKINTYHKIITPEIDPQIMNKMRSIFSHFGKMDYMRIDGKLYENDFYLIEFTPDASLSAHCSFKDVYMQNQKNYDWLLVDIIKSALENYQIL